MFFLVKRIIDFSLSLFLLVASFPLILIFSIILFFELHQFPFYTQKRGLSVESKLFTIYKLRTLQNSDGALEDDTNKDIFLKPYLSHNVTRFAGWLRKTGLDELPQIINILFGQMSFIGPRPLMEHDLKIMKNSYQEYYKLRTKIKSKPGITGLWQLFGDRNKGIKNLLGLEIVYEKFRSARLDYHLFLATIPVIFGARNSDAILQNNGTFRYLPSITNSSGFNLNLELPNELKDFDLNILEKDLDGYQISIPQNWWYVSDTFKSNKTTPVKIIKIDGKTGRRKINKSA